MPLTQQYYEEGEQVEVNLGHGWMPAKVLSVRSRRRFGGPWIYGVRLDDGKYEEFKTGRGIRKLRAKGHAPAEPARVVKRTRQAVKIPAPAAKAPIPQPRPAQPAMKAPASQPAPAAQPHPAAPPRERRKVGRPSEDLEMISARIHREDLAAVAELARKLRLTRAVVIREALRRGLVVIDRDGLQPVADVHTRRSGV